jgi:transcriptional regulator with XRE-family HTH domain
MAYRLPSDTANAVVSALIRGISEARLAAGVSQERLAELSGVDLGVISRAERLQRIPGMASILDLAIALQLDFPTLVQKAIIDGQKATS